VNADRFTELQARAVEQEGGEAMQMLWKAVFELDEWCFLQYVGPDGQPPAGPPPFGMPTPLTVRLEGKRFVACFTSAERVADAARTNDLVHPEHGVPVLCVPRDSATLMLTRMNDGTLDGVLFNQNEGEQGFFAPLGNIASMYEWYLDRLPPGLFDAFVKGVVQSNVPPAWGRLHRRIVLMDQWFFIGDKDRPKAPRLYSHENNIAVLVFTDADHADRGASAVGGADGTGRVPMIPSTPKAAADYLKELRAHSEGKVRDALFNLGSEPFVISIDDIERIVAMR
jgi:hypothetical protein